MKFITLISLPKSFYASWRLTNFRQAFSFPVLAKYNTVFRSLKGHLESPLIGKKVGILQVGFDCGEGTADRKIRSVLEINGTIKVEESCRLGIGSRIDVGEGALWEMKSFGSSSRLFLVCKKHIKMGKNIRSGWENTIFDSDLHPILNVETGKYSEPHLDVVIEDGAWLGSKCIILKGSKIAANSIVCAGAMVSGRFRHENAIIVGNPAKELMTGYTYGGDLK